MSQCQFIGGIVALIAGYLGRKEIKQSNGAQTGDGMALTGIILGASNLAVICLGFVCFAAIAIVAIANQ